MLLLTHVLLLSHVLLISQELLLLTHVKQHVDPMVPQTISNQLMTLAESFNYRGQWTRSMQGGVSYTAVVILILQ